MSASDRTVHAATASIEVVRYDRAGKWYLEPVGHPELRRQAVSINEAVDYVAWAHREIGVQINYGKPGGGMFDGKVKAKVGA